jgi:hypothetical protein
MNKPSLISKIQTAADRCLSRLVRPDRKVPPKSEWTDQEENEFWLREAMKTRHNHDFTPAEFKQALIRYHRDCEEKGIEYKRLA